MSIPNSDTSVVIPTDDKGHEETIDFLNRDDDKEIIDLEPKPKSGKVLPVEDDKDEKTDEDKDKVDEEVDELEELENELEPPTDEQLELVVPVRRKEILAKYPQLFKDFPYLEKAYYREQQFTELLPTLDDAREAVEAKKVLDRFETDVMGGNTETILKAIKSESPKGFARIVDDYLITLAKVDEPAYFHVIGNLTKNTIVAMVKEARSSGNEALQSAAQLLNQFVFGTSDFQPPTNLSKNEPESDGKSKELEQREQAFRTQQFESARGDLNTRINNTLSNTIDANIDPKKSMTDYVRKNASREALETLENVLSRDTRFQALKDKLWEAAFKSNFNRESIERIKSAYLSRAKTLLPTVIKKARIDALKGLGKRVDEGEETTLNKGPLPVGQPRSITTHKSGKITKAEDIPKGMRTLDFLNSD